MISCPICDSTDINFSFSSTDINYRLSSKLYQIYNCSNCSVFFQWPIPGENEIKSFYSDEYNEHYESDKLRATNKLKKVTKKIISYIISKNEEAYRENKFDNLVFSPFRFFFGNPSIELIQGEIGKQEIRVLDVGCGAGVFLEKIARCTNVKYSLGCDFSKNAVDTCRRKGLNVLQGTIKDVEEKNFNVIILKHILEHVPNPYEFLFEIKKRITDDGILLISLPNSDSIGRWIFRKYWAGFDVPRHIFTYNKKSLNFLLQKTGFEIIKCKYDLIFVNSINPLLGKLRHTDNFVNSYITQKFFLIISKIVGLVNYADQITLIARKI
ncbi:MAG: class I SAM-dependent methyltransferase [candidate division KSB1 bacterium]|nr:class I SAM-dependent methyltransferase [candidate division KSB1 bacterium]